MSAATATPMAPQATLPTTTPTTTTVPPTPPTAPVSKGRKGAAAGGGKAWTEEEEVYLLQMRLERVAYKKIAAHLCKTELACRLHYHQLSHGGNRRKRTASISSASSTTSSPSASTPPNAPSFSPVNAHGAIHKASSAPRTKPKGKPLLPKPTQTPRKQNKSGLKLTCSTPNTPIDQRRLREIVRSNEKSFWDQVALQYGGAVSSEDLQRVWREESGYGTETPPTPGVSPKAEEVSEFGLHVEVESIAEEEDDVDMTTVSTTASQPTIETLPKLAEVEVETSIVSSPTPTAVSAVATSS